MYLYLLLAVFIDLSILSTERRGTAMYWARSQPFCLLKKLNVRQFYREYRKNLNIRVLRVKFWIESGCEDSPQNVPAWPTQSVFWSTFVFFWQSTACLLLAPVTLLRCIAWANSFISFPTSLAHLFLLLVLVSLQTLCFPALSVHFSHFLPHWYFHF